MRTLMRALGCFPVLVIAAGCGSTDSGGSTPGGGAGGTGAKAGAGGAGAGAGTGGMGATAGSGGSGGGAGSTSGGGTGGSTGGTGGSAGGGGAAGVAGIASPMPKAGTTRCGSGSFTGTEAFAACQAPPQVGSLHPNYPSQCSLASTSGGQWETWCSSTGIAYVWVRFNQLKAGQSCSLIPTFGFSHQELSYSGTSNSGEPVEAQPLTNWTIKATAVDLGLHFEIANTSGPSAKNGGGQIWLAGTTYCGSPAVEGRATFLSFAFNWAVGS